MAEKKEYVKPITQKNELSGISLKEIYENLHPHYWKRKLIHLLIIIPVVWLIYMLLIWFSLPETLTQTGIVASVVAIIAMIISTILTLISAVFYPYSLYWYKRSFLGQVLNNMIYLGGFWAVIFKTIATLIGGVIIAGVFSPIAGVLTWLSCRKKKIMIGEEGDFD